jgi:DNA-binding transcriptional MerR regulator
MKKFLKVSEVANLCGCCGRTIRNLTDENKIVCYRNQNNYRLIPVAEALKAQKILVGEKINSEN